MTLGPKTKPITMTNTLRDTKVELPGEKASEDYACNAIYSLGYVSGYGAEILTVETVKN